MHAKARRLDPRKLAIAKDEFAAMEKLGIIRRSNSPWASPLHLVPKANRGWHVVTTDALKASPHLTVILYPISRIFQPIWREHLFFRKWDLIRGYHQVPVSPRDIPKTAVIIPFGLFEFLRMPFGLKNAAQTFQRLMDVVLRGLSFVFVYLDDILIASSSREEHLSHLRLLFGRLREHG